MSISFNDISRMTLFRGFDESFIKLLDLFFVEKNYEANVLLVEEGKLQTNWFMIFAGEVQVQQNVGEKPVILATLSAGQFFGEMNLFDPGVATASVISLTPVRTLQISNEKFRYFIKYKPALAADFMFQLAQVIVKRYRDSSNVVTGAAKEE